MSTKKYHHIRIKDPKHFDSNSFRVIELGNGIKATIGCQKGWYYGGRCRKGTETQKLLFPKDRYTEKEAMVWVKKHPTIKRKK